MIRKIRLQRLALKAIWDGQSLAERYAASKKSVGKC